MITKKELLADFGEFLEEAIEVYCEQMELDEEATRFLVQSLNEAGPLNFMRKRDENNPKRDKKAEKEEQKGKSPLNPMRSRESQKEEVEIDQARLGNAFRQYLTAHTFNSLEEAIDEFCVAHELGDVNRQKLVDYVNEAQGKSSVTTPKMFTPDAGKKTSLSEEVSPNMQRYLRALGC